ncbi:hypothetical protein [Rhodococcus pyridinivorans]|uniref:hypothetical protein n=1 Tax=Rhodococcus pyridinivorans TaxID=103816 RepID=UPI0013A6F2B2|nr:hypothetical protein [Rhodococcus pyridinivorans]
MSFSDHATRPAEWSARRMTGRLAASLIFMTLLALPAILIAAGGVIEGDPDMTKYGILISCALLTLIVSGVITHTSRNRPGAIRTRVWNGAPATVVEYSTAVFCLVGVLMTTGAALFLMAAGDVFLRGGGGATVLVGVVFTGIGLLGASFVPFIAIGRLRRGRLVLTPELVHQRGWSLESTLDWDSIVAARPAVLTNWVIMMLGHPAARWERKTTVPRGLGWDALPSTPMIEVYCHKHAVDPVLLYRLLQFYVEHPQYRGELGTDVALERARSNRY